MVPAVGVSKFRRHPSAPRHVLDCVCRDNVDYLDMALERIEMRPIEFVSTASNCCFAQHWPVFRESINAHRHRDPPRGVSTLYPRVAKSHRNCGMPRR
jgi:hypothetical protein